MDLTVKGARAEVEPVLRTIATVHDMSRVVLARLLARGEVGLFF